MSEKLWAPWRLEYIADAGRQETCVFCDEAAGKLGDESLVVARGERAFVLLNKFPYASGHLMVAPVRHVAELADLEADEVAELHALAVAAIEALRRVYGPDAFNVGLEPRRGRRRLDLRAPPRARRPALGGRHELHAGARGREGRARAPRRHARAAARGMARVIRELAENPNLHQPLGPGPAAPPRPRGALRALPRRGRSPHAATVQRVRVGGDGVEHVLERRSARSSPTEGREGAEWELGESSEPTDLVAAPPRASASSRTATTPSPTAWCCGACRRSHLPQAWSRGRWRPWPSCVRRARCSTPRSRPRSPIDEEQLRLDHEREGVDGTTFVAFVDGELVAAAYASYTPYGSILFGGATLPAARGRGAYRALVAARAAEAAARGAPSVVTHAGRMSLPILERLGFERVARIDRLLDVL